MHVQGFDHPKLNARMIDAPEHTKRVLVLSAGDWDLVEGCRGVRVGGEVDFAGDGARGSTTFNSASLVVVVGGGGGGFGFGFECCS